ncbi:hypothetical protein ABK040_003434 [Willaertia magna]
MPMVFVAGNSRLTFLFLGLFLFFQFFHHLMELYNPSSSIHSDSTSSYIDDHGRVFEGLQSTFNSRVLRIPRALQINYYSSNVFSSSKPNIQERKPNTFQLYETNNDISSSPKVKPIANYLILSSQDKKEDKKEDGNFLEVVVDNTGRTISNERNGTLNSLSNNTEEEGWLFQYRVEEGNEMNGTFFVNVNLLVAVNENNDKKELKLEDLMLKKMTNNLQYKLLRTDKINNVIYQFTKRGVNHPLNRECIFIILEVINYEDDNSSIQKHYEVRRYCINENNNRIFKLKGNNAISAISDSKMDKDCLIVSRENDLFEFQVVCSDGLIVSKGPKRNIFDKRSVNDMLAVHEMMYDFENKQQTVFSLREDSNEEDVRDSLYTSMYESSIGPSIETKLFKKLQNTGEQNDWEILKLRNNLRGVLTNVYSRNTKKLTDAYYKGKEITTQSANGKVVAFPCHGGSVYLFRFYQEHKVLENKIQYYEYLGNGNAPTDINTIVNKYYEQDQVSLMIFDSLTKKLEKYNHPSVVSLNEDGSILIVVHKSIGFVFKFEGRGFSLQMKIQKKKSQLATTKPTSQSYKLSSPQSSVLDHIEDVRFINKNTVSVLFTDGSIGFYDLMKRDPEGSYKDMYSSDNGITSSILEGFMHRPKLVLILVVVTTAFIYNEYRIRKRNQQQRTQQHAQQQTPQNPPQQTN